MNNMTFKITRQQMGEIYSNVGCEWKNRIIHLMYDYFTMFADEAFIPYNVVKSTFDDPTFSQKELLESIFVDYKESIVKEHALVMVSMLGSTWELGIYLNKNNVYLDFDNSLGNDPREFNYIVLVSEFDFNDPKSNIYKSIV